MTELTLLLGERVATSDGSIATWEQIFPEGVFKHPVYKVLDFRKEFFDRVIANFNNRVRGIDIAIDLHHENRDACGWIKELSHRSGEGLYALIEWTDLGVEKVTKKLLRYFSPEIGPHIDELTGDKFSDVLMAVTLTNVPFLKRNKEVQIQMSELAMLSDPEQRCLTCGEMQADCTCKEMAEKKPPPSEDDEDDEDDEDEEDGEKKKKPRTARAPGNQGAPQPGAMRGPKPHITRNRTPNPAGEINNMSDTTENTGAAETLTMEEFREVTKRLEDQLRMEKEARTQLAERLASSENERLSMVIDTEIRTLSEARAAADGTPARFGIPSVVSDMYRHIAMSESVSRTQVFEILRKLQETGMVALTERGTGHTGVENDPERTADMEFSDRVQVRAEALALAEGKTMAAMSMSERELLYVRAETAEKNARS